MPLLTGSERMIELLNRVFESVKEKNEDIFKSDSEYWSTFKSKEKEVNFVYLQPQVNGIRIFPKLPCEVIKSLNPDTIEIRTTERGGRWGETYKCWFKIWESEQIPETLQILNEAYKRIISGKIEKEEEQIIEEEKEDEQKVIDAIDYKVEVSNEKQVQNYIWNNKENILLEDGLNITNREHDTGAGFVDFFGIDKEKVPVLIEVKLNASDSAIGQLVGYMQAIKEKVGYDNVRGILVTQDFSSRVKMASKNIGLKIVRFNVELKFTEEK